MQRNKKINIVIKILAIIILAMIMIITNKTETKAAYNASNNTITGVIRYDGVEGAQSQEITIQENGIYSIFVDEEFYTSESGYTETATPDFRFLVHKNVYCIMRGYIYTASPYYRCVGIKKIEGEIGAKVGYAVSKQELNRRSIFLDAVTNLIWTYSDNDSTPFAVNGYNTGNLLPKVPLEYEEGYRMENGVSFSWNLNPNYLYRIFWMRTDAELGVIPYWQPGNTPQEIINLWTPILGEDYMNNSFDSETGTITNIQGLRNYFETEKTKFERYKILAELAPAEELPDDIIYSNSQTITQNSNGLYGPFKIDYLSAENVPDATGTNNTYMLGKVTMTIGGIEVSPENIVDAAGNKCTIPVKLDEDNGATIQELPKSGEEFYIKADGIENGAELKIKYDYNIYSSAFARFHRNGYDAQDLAYIDYEITPATIEKTFTLQAEETIDIFFKKIVPDGTPDGAPGVGAQFRVDFENATNIDGNTTMNFTVYTTGTFEIQRIKITNPDQDVKITITELAPPPSSDVTCIPYKTPIVIYLRYDKTTKAWGKAGEQIPTYDKDGKELLANVSIDLQGGVLAITAVNDIEENTPPIPPPTGRGDYGGYVWVDAQSGLKPVKSPDGIYNGQEETLSGVVVKINYIVERTSIEYTVDADRETETVWIDTDNDGVNDDYYIIYKNSYDQKIDKNTSTRNGSRTCVTDSNGTYSFYEQILKKKQNITTDKLGNYIELLDVDTTQINTYEDYYDGPKGLKTGEIIQEKVISYEITFTYDGINYESIGISGESVADDVDREAFNRKFQTVNISTIDQNKHYTFTTNQANLETMEYNSNYSSNVAKQEFAINATTGKRSGYNNKLNLGLIRRGVDLATVTDVYSATVSINGESITYNYNDIASLPTNQYGNPIIDELQGTDVTYNLYLYNSDYNYRIGDYKLGAAQSGSLAVNEYGASNALKAQRESDGALQVEVIYQVLLNNQSAAEATINQIAYYYDTHYTLKEVYYDRNGSKTTLYDYPSGTQSINGKNYAKVTVNTSSIAKLTDSDNQTVIYFKFIINDLNGALYLGQRKNWVEITEYYTQEGLIDTDSAPGNISSHPLEDDSDDAATLDVKLNDQEREISGYVFEDYKESDVAGGNNIGNGMHDSNEPMVNDVIVQLIEIKDVTVGNTTLRLEYIWQETVSGSNTVKYVTSDGTSYGEYSVSNTDGGYTFKGFIPGNYIVRFVYGDDEYWDSAKNTQNILKYNGQDYKSTVDMYYTETEFENSSYPANASMARDNEARRLEEMAYARSISETDVSQLLIDEKSKLEDTWMCAETSLMWLEISDNKDEGDSRDYIKRNANFGLIERPRADLVLEKHITSLTIDAEQDVEAITNFDNYDRAIYNGLMVNLIANNGEGVLSSATHKILNNRGRWLVQMDPAKVAGGSIRITYGYRIENLGDADYLGPQLVSQLNAGKTYEQIANEVKILTSQPGYIPGAYLGIRYYNVNGGRDPGEEESSIPFQVEDYMSTEDGLNLQAANSFAIAVNKQNELVWTYPTRNASEASPIQELEEVTVLQSREIMTLYANEPTYANGDIVTLTLYDDSIDSISGVKEIVYRSYASQLIYPTSGVKTSDTGTLNKNSTLGNLQTVQSYATLASVPISHITPEADEFIAETVEITLDTGGEDKQAPVILIISITTGLAVIVIGIVLIKKFIIK